MRGDLYNGWVTLAGDFPPTLNKEDDPTKLKPFESPDCYGVDCDAPGRLKVGSLPTGTARIATTKTIRTTQTWNWYLNRLWQVRSNNILLWGSPYYDDKYVPQGVSKHQFDQTIVTYMPCLQDSMWISTASGSYILNFAKDNRGFFNMNQLSQEMTVATANHALTLGTIPFAGNAQGLFSYDGKAVKEWTAKVRNTLGSFSDKTITANYTKGWIIGDSSFVVDTTNEKIFDYGTSGFRFTTRTLVGDNGNAPYTIGKIAFIIEHSDAADGTINWQSKVEEGEWMNEEDIVCVYQQGEYARIETELTNDITTCHRFALRLTGLSSNIKIKSIEICVQGLAQGSISE